MWTAAEDAAVRGLTDARELGELARRLGRTRKACVQRRHTLGLPILRDPPREWTAEEDVALADITRTLAQVARAIGRTRPACALRAHRLGIVRQREVPPEEQAERKQRWLEQRRSERVAAGLCIRCGRRRAMPELTACRRCQDQLSNPGWRQQHREATTQYARNRRARDANAGRHKRRWTAEEDSQLMDYSRTLAQIAADLGRSEASVACRTHRLGLPPRESTSGRGRTTRAPRGPARQGGEE